MGRKRRAAAANRPLPFGKYGNRDETMQIDEMTIRKELARVKAQYDKLPTGPCGPGPDPERMTGGGVVMYHRLQGKIEVLEDILGAGCKHERYEEACISGCYYCPECNAVWDHRPKRREEPQYDRDWLLAEAKRRIEGGGR